MLGAAERNLTGGSARASVRPLAVRAVAVAELAVRAYDRAQDGATL
jgi:hypothetical protein